MITAVLKEKKVDIAGRGRNIFGELSNSIRKSIPQAGLKGKILGLFGGGTTAENVNEIIKKNLLEDPSLVQFAPRTKVEFENPRNFQQQWLDMFQKTFGRPATMTDVNKAAEQARLFGLPERFIEP